MEEKQTYGKDDKQAYVFTGVQTLRVETKRKVIVYKWEWNSVDGYKFYSGSTGKQLKRVPKHIMKQIEMQKAVLLHPFFAKASPGGVDFIANTLLQHNVTIDGVIRVWKSTRVKVAMTHILYSGETTLELTPVEKVVLRLRYGYTV